MARRRLLILATVGVLLLVGGIPAMGHTSATETVEGLWEYIPTIQEESLVGDTVLLKVTDREWWSGGLDGTSKGRYSVMIYPSGRWFFAETSAFTGTVNGRSGRMTMAVYGGRPNDQADWEGRWMIIGGTGELEGIRGSGSFSGPGWLGDPKVRGKVDYRGSVTFAE